MGCLGGLFRTQAKRVWMGVLQCSTLELLFSPGILGYGMFVWFKPSSIFPPSSKGLCSQAVQFEGPSAGKMHVGIVFHSLIY